MCSCPFLGSLSLVILPNNSEECQIPNAGIQVAAIEYGRHAIAPEFLVFSMGNLSY
jgi:hypothetical protein